MKKYGLPEPEFYEERDSFKVIFRNEMIDIKEELFEDLQQSDTRSRQVSGQDIKSIDEYKSILLKYCTKPRTAREIREHLQIKSRQYISTNIIKPLIDEGMLEYTNKKHKSASNQKYVATRK